MPMEAGLGMSYAMSHVSTQFTPGLRALGVVAACEASRFQVFRPRQPKSNLILVSRANRSDQHVRMLSSTLGAGGKKLFDLPSSFRVNLCMSTNTSLLQKLSDYFRMRIRMGRFSRPSFVSKQV